MNEALLGKIEDPLGWDHILYFFIGWGTSWTVPTAIGQQVPIYERSQPEGYCIAAYNNIANGLAILPLYLYMYLIKLYGPDFIQQSTLIYGMLGSNVCICIFNAFLYHYTIGEWSVYLFVSVFWASVIGSMGLVVMYAYLMDKKPKIITCTRAGGSFAALSCGMLAGAQQPGKTHPNFSSTVYMLIFAGLMVVPLPAFWYAHKYKVGMKTLWNKNENRLNTSEHSNKSDQMDKERSISQTSVSINGSVVSIIENPLSVTVGSIRNQDEDKVQSQYGMTSASTSIDRIYPNGEDHDTEEDFDEGKMYSLVQLFHLQENSVGYQFCTTFVGSYAHSPFLTGWMCKTLPYTAVICLIDFNTWGILGSFAPFAFENMSPEGKSYEFQSYSIMVVGFVMLAGDSSTWFGHMPFYIIIPIYCILSLIVLICASVGRDNVQPSNASAITLVIILGTIRFIDPHVVTSCLRRISKRISPHNAQRASRFTGLLDQTFVFFGAIAAYCIIQSSFEC
jgi:hypothetical protein